MNEEAWHPALNLRIFEVTRTYPFFETRGVVCPGMRKRAQREKLQDAQLQENERGYSVQCSFSFTVRTFGCSVSAASGSEEPS
jgi:hypothetical protein